MRLKHTVSKKNRKTRNKTYKKVRFQKRRGGSCGCESSNPVGKFFIGGTPTTNALLTLPANNYYPLNDYSKDPNYLVVSSGQTGNYVKTGGKRRKNKQLAKTNKRNGKNKRRSVKGGGYVSDVTALVSPAISATMVGANSFGLNGTSFTPPPFSMYSATNPPPSA